MHSAAEIVQSIHRHFTLGCERLTTPQYLEHKRRLACPGCEGRSLAAEIEKTQGVTADA